MLSKNQKKISLITTSLAILSIAIVIIFMENINLITSVFLFIFSAINIAITLYNFKDVLKEQVFANSKLDLLSKKQKILSSISSALVIVSLAVVILFMEQLSLLAGIFLIGFAMFNILVTIYAFKDVIKEQVKEEDKEIKEVPKFKEVLKDTKTY